MSEFTVHLSQPIAGVSTPLVNTTVRLRTDIERDNRQKQALSAMAAAAHSLASIERLIKARVDALAQEISLHAIDVARSVLNGDSALIEKRVAEFVQAAIGELRPAPPRQVFVHSTCAETIKRWVEEQESPPIEIISDDSVAPGDCRVESGAAGVAATLEAFFDAAHEKLAGSMRGNG